MFELHSYLQFTYEYVVESFKLKTKNDTLEKKKKKSLRSSYAKLTTAATTHSNEAG